MDAERKTISIASKGKRQIGYDSKSIKTLKPKGHHRRGRIKKSRLSKLKDSTVQSEIDENDKDKVVIKNETDISIIHTPSDDESDINLLSRDYSIVKKIKINFKLPPPAITHPNHIPKKEYGSLDTYLSSFKSLDEDYPIQEYNHYISDQVKLLQKINEAKKDGILSEDGPKRKELPFIDSIKSQTHQDHLITHAIHFSKLMSDERRFHMSQCRKISGMILAHFKKQMGAADRAKKENERRVRQLARNTVNHVKKRWQKAEKAYKIILQQQQDEARKIAGKKHLSEILKKSSDLLTSQRQSISTRDLEDTSDEANFDENDDDDVSIEELRKKYAALEDFKIGSDKNNNVEDNESINDLTSDSSLADSDDESLIDSDDEDDDQLNIEEDKEETGNNFNKESQLNLNTGIEQHDSVLDESDEDILSDTDSSMTDDDSSDDDEDDNDGEQIEHRSALADLFSSNPKDMEDETEYSSESEDVGEKEPELEPSRSSSPDVLEDNEKDQSEPTPSSSPEDEKDSTGIKEITIEEQPSKGFSDTPQVSDVPDVLPLLRGTLREYQKQGVDWLVSLFHNRTNGILADEMGLGKTIQTIALLSYLASERHIWGPHLIVVPTSVMLNWEMEFKRFAPGFKVLTYYGSPAQRKEKRRGWNKEDSWHICITSYQLVVQDHQAFRRKRWNYMVLDEAHNIKNFHSRRWQSLLNFNTEHRLLLTGTPLQNNIAELWSLLYFLMPSTKAVQSMPEGFANLQDFQQWFGKPIDNIVEITSSGGNSINEEAKNTVNKLHQVLRPFLLRRLKADVEKQMPAKYEHIIYCRLSKRQRYLYDDFMSRAQTKETLASGNFLSIINCLMQLRKVCNHPDLFEVRPINTSFGIEHSVVSDFTTKALLVKKQFLQDHDDKEIDLKVLNLIPALNESMSMKEYITVSKIKADKQLYQECLKLDGLIAKPVAPNFSSLEEFQKYQQYETNKHDLELIRHKLYINSFRSVKRPMYGTDTVSFLTIKKTNPYSNDSVYDWSRTKTYDSMVLDVNERHDMMKDSIEKFAFVTPAAVTLDMPSLTLGPSIPEEELMPLKVNYKDPFHQAQVKLSIAMPDKHLLQFDCGKLQKLASLLLQLKAGGHRALIFTQMTKVLDILEQFLNIHGYLYLRLDGATKIEDRQISTERFNNDPRITCFILSTRSGGLGINLTGADTVIFYDSDWNPAMDKQCQDRCHRIGQTRDVHIYRFVSEHTIESNILRKANQKRMLDNVVIQDGDFTTDYFTRLSVSDLLGSDIIESDDKLLLQDGNNKGGNIEKVLAEAEDVDDAAAARVAMKEVALDVEDFDESNSVHPSRSETPGLGLANGESSTPQASSPQSSLLLRSDATPDQEGMMINEEQEQEQEQEREEDEDDNIGDIEEYMIRFIRDGYYWD